MANNLADFKVNELYPALFDKIDKAFPEFDFKLIAGNWKSYYRLDLSKSSAKDKTYVGKNRPDLVSENGGETLSLIDLDIRLHGGNFLTSLKRLADICGLELPDTDSEEYKAYEERQRHREDALRTFKDALWSGSAEAEKVLSYLRDSRRWTDEEIKKAELGYIDETIKATLPDYSEYDSGREEKAVDGSSIPVKIGTTHRLVIPYRSKGRLFGFKVRDVETRTKTKYLNTRGLSKSGGLFAIPIGCKDVTIVEGELDALHAIVKGAANVVATTGNGAGEEQVRDAIKGGVKRFTLLFDNDEAGSKFTESSIATIERLRAEAYVASLPEGSKDTDEFLQFHTIEEWKEAVENAIPSHVWRLRRTISKYSDKATELGGLNGKELNDFFSEAEAVVNSAPTNWREILFAELQNNEAALPYYKTEDLRSFMDEAYVREQAKTRKTEAERAALSISDSLKAGDVDAALKTMRDTSTTLSATEKATKFAKTFAPLSVVDATSLLSEIREGVPTGYEFRQGHNKVTLKLNAGLTFVCGYTGHGKTTFLNNVLLNVAKRDRAIGNGRKCLYFSYEMDKRRVLYDLINTYVNDPDIQRYNPLESIQSYYRGAGSKYFKNERRPDGLTHFEYFKRESETFLREYISTGAISIVEENFKVEELIEAIRYYLKHNSVTAIFIDYAQLIYSEEYSRQRTEEIKKVVNDLKDFANATQLPIVLAAQFNREGGESPVDVLAKNIGEGGDFERIAETCIGIFNLKELRPLQDKNKSEAVKRLLFDLDVIGKHTAENGKLVYDELEPIYDRLFVRLIKRRFEAYPIDVILEWEGKTKFIKANAPESLDVTPQQQTIDFQAEASEEAPF